MALFGIEDELLKFDKRLTERLIRKGMLTRGEVETWLAKLNDQTDRAEYVSIDDAILNAGRRIDTRQTTERELGEILDD
jgi:hypothetical protein